MEIFRFDHGVGLPMRRFNSTNATLSRIIQLEGEIHINCIYLEPGGHIGYHLAETRQLFLVVEGSGWVSAETSDRKPILTGRAAFWQAGEGHEVGADNLMTAIVVEGSNLEPGKFMPKLEG